MYTDSSFSIGNNLLLIVSVPVIARKHQENEISQEVWF